MKLGWATDLHLSFASNLNLNLFKQEVLDNKLDGLLISGDISNGKDLYKWMEWLDKFNIPIYFVLGNHDFYFNSIVTLKSLVKDEIEISNNLICGNKAIDLGEFQLILIDGFYDCFLGEIKSNVVLNDFFHIKEFMPYCPAFSNGHKISISLVNEIKSIAEKELNELKSIPIDKKTIILTHVPPFHQACMYDNKPTGEEYIPFFCWQTAGDYLKEQMVNNKEELLILAGHTHHVAEVNILPNLKIKVGGARYGFPRLQEIINV